MKNKFILMTVPMLAALSLFACKDNGDGGEEPVKDPYVRLYVSGGSALTSEMNLDMERSVTEVKVMSNTAWRLDVPAAADWLRIDPSSGKGNAEITVEAQSNEGGSERTASVGVVLGEEKLFDLKVIQKGKQEEVVERIPADLLDVEFAADGTARDVSPMHHSITTMPSSKLMTYFSESHDRYVANFRNSLGGSTSTGFYRVAYADNSKFQSKIYDGCTMETVFMLGEENSGDSEIKWFGSTEAGGMCFILPRSANDPARSITFLSNVSSTGSSKWVWTCSGVTPKPGTYYHAVGVWNKSEGKAYIYINGELKATTDAPGSMVPVKTGAEYFLIGGDPNTSGTSTNSWNGDIAIARIYDAPLTAEQVKTLWKAVEFDQNAEYVSISDVEYLPVCEVGDGYKYTVYGNGFKAGDEIILQPVGGSSSQVMDCTVTESSATITIPGGFASGEYRMLCRRGTSYYPLGVAEFEYSSSPRVPVNPKIIAHRGIHTDGVPENSCAALEKAMKAGVYGSEMDIWITLDGVLVVNHNSTTSTGVSIQNSNYDDIKNVTLSNGEKLPTFEDYLATFKANMSQSQTKLIVEIKSHSTVAATLKATEAAMKMIEEQGLKERVEYIAFSYDACKYIAAQDPQAVVGYLNGDKAPSAVAADKISSIDYAYAKLMANRAWIRQAQELGMIVNIWTVNTASDMLMSIGVGVDYITTDHCDVLAGLYTKTYVSAQ